MLRNKSGGPSRAEKGVKGKVYWVVSQGQIRGSWQSLGEIRGPVQAPWSAAHELRLGVRFCFHSKPDSSWMCQLTQSLTHLWLRNLLFFFFF